MSVPIWINGLAYLPAVEHEALAAELVDWKRMRNEAMAVATSNRARITYLEGALRVIAEGTICPDLFPIDTDENVIAAKTAMVTAIAALEHSESERPGDAK